MANVYDLQNVSKVYRNEGKEFTALRDVSLSISEGEIFGIIGMSGAGKSTLVRTLNRLEDVTGGTVRFYDKDLALLSQRELRKVRHSISMIFQSFNLLGQRTVIQNVEQPLRIAGIPKAQRYKKALEMLEIVGLTDKQNVYPARLSGGQRQRVAIARALALSVTEYFGLPYLMPGPVRRAVVETVSGPLNLRGAPSSSGQILTSIPGGSMVEVLNAYNGWYVTRYQDTLGYVLGEYLRFI